MRLIIDIKIKNLKRAVEFYRDKLQLPCRVVEKDWAAISVGDAEIHLYLDGGVTSDVEFYVENIDSDVSKYAERGVVFVSGIDKPSAISVDTNNITTFPWGRTAFFKDSEDNDLALVQDF